jgi:hypothetical protein
MKARAAIAACLLLGLSGPVIASVSAWPIKGGATPEVTRGEARRVFGELFVDMTPVPALSQPTLTEFATRPSAVVDGLCGANVLSVGQSRDETGSPTPVLRASWEVFRIVGPIEPVAGSDQAGVATAADCAKRTEVLFGFFYADDANVALAAAWLVQLGGAEAASDRPQLSFDLTCRVGQEGGLCADARASLASLRTDDIFRALESACDPVVDGKSCVHVLMVDENRRRGRWSIEVRGEWLWDGDRPGRYKIDQVDMASFDAPL